MRPPPLDRPDAGSLASRDFEGIGRQKTTPATTKNAIVIANRPLTPEVIEISLRPESPAGEPFRAGQYLMIETGRGAPRAYSIASPPSAPRELQLCVKRLPHGPVSNYLASLREGDRIAYTGPHGSFTLVEGSSRDLLFVATGTGLAPLRSMVLDLLGRRETRRADLVHGVRGEADLIYSEELRHLESHFANFRYHPCLSRPDGAAWAGHRGRVTAVLPRLLPSAGGREVYLCGGGEMIRDVIALLSRLGLDRSLCFYEDWY